MEYLVRVTAKALAKQGINCNAVIPGNVLEGGKQSAPLEGACWGHRSPSLVLTAPRSKDAIEAVSVAR